MRIIAGEWRGRRIEAPPGEVVRPTADRVREAWMSILQWNIPGARVVDLFSGSGALGLEALSRGAAFVDFVEVDARSIKSLEANIGGLGATGRCAIHRQDAIEFVTSRAEEPPCDLAFADPPYRLEFASRLAGCWLAAPFSAIFGVEHERAAVMPEGGDRRTYGATALTIYRKPDAR